MAALPNGPGTNEHALKETEIIQKFVRSILKGIDQSKSTSAADKKTDAEKAKKNILVLVEMLLR